MWNSHPADDNGLWYRPNRSNDVFDGFPTFFDAAGEPESDPAADRTLLQDPPQPGTYGFVVAALSWLLRFFIEGFAACGYAMCPYVIDPNETFESWAERRRMQGEALSDGGPSREASDER